MARRHKSLLYERGTAGFHEFIQKKIPHNLAVLSSSFMLWSDMYSLTLLLISLLSVVSFRSFGLFRFGRFVSLFQVLVDAIRDRRRRQYQEQRLNEKNNC